MVLEATVVCLDNSDWMRNGDYTPTRLEAQQDAINLICGAKTQQNPENTVAALAGAGKSPEVLVTLTSDLGKILSSLHGTKVGGTFDFLGAMQVAQLVLKHRQNKNQHQRVVVFVGSPLSADQDSLVRLAKRLKKNNIAVDIVNFGEEAENTEKLEAFVGAVNSNDNSHLVTVPPGPHILSDILISSPVIAGEEGAAAGGGGGGGDFGAYGGVDPNLEPELALALKVSMEEERARQEAARKAEAAQTETPSQPTTAVQPTSTEVQMGEASGEMDDEALLQQAIALSMQAEKATAPTPTVPTTVTQDVHMEDDDDDLKLAMQMSLAANTSQPSTQEKPAEGGDLSAAMNDPSFVNSLLASLPGVDPDDERIKNALKQLEKKDK